jgi:hypothetical protein
MAKTKQYKKKKLSEISTPDLMADLAGDKKKNLLAAGDNEEIDIGKGVTAKGDEETVDPSKLSTGVKKKDEDKDEDIEKLQDEGEIFKEIETLLPIAIKADANWMLEAKEDINFCLGEQWEEQDKSDLKRQNRPVMVFNKIKPLVQLVTGHLIQTKARIQAFPEGGEDERFTAVMDKAMDHIEKVSHLNFKMSYLFSGGEKAGKNWLEFTVDYDDDPIFGQLKIPNLGPFKVFMDPSGVEYDLSDCGFGFKVQEITKGRLKQLYPDKKDEIDHDVDNSIKTFITNSQQIPSGDESDYGNSPIVPRGGQVSDGKSELKGDNQPITTVDYWKKSYVERWFLYFVEDGAIEEFDTEEESQAEVSRRQKMKHDKLMQEHHQMAQKLMAAKAAVHPQGPIAPHVSTPPPIDDVTIPEAPTLESVKIEHAMKKRRVVKMQVSVWAGKVCLTDGFKDSPFEPYYSGYPFFRYIAEWSPEAEKNELKYQGMVRSLKDPQREKNKARSQFLHILNTSANSGWVGDDDALSPEKWDELKDYGAVAGITVRKKPGSQLERIQPVSPSTAQEAREAKADDSFKECSGLNADLLSMEQNETTSGKAIALRIRQAITILQPSLENFRYTKVLIGKFLFSIIPSLFDSAKLQKVLGEKFMEENKIDRNALNAYLTMVHDGKYHVNINEAGAPDTLREETFEDLMQLAQHGVALPPDLFISYMNMSNKTEILNKVQEWTKMQAQMTLATKGKQKLGRSR